ncbi:hypothetical protein D9M68_704300 [compost metagenome]
MVQAGIIFSRQYFLYTFLQPGRCEFFLFQRILYLGNTLRYIFGKQQHIISGQEGLQVCFSVRIVLGHALHVQGIGEDQPLESHFVLQQIGHDLFG